MSSKEYDDYGVRREQIEPAHTLLGEWRECKIIIPAVGMINMAVEIRDRAMQISGSFTVHDGHNAYKGEIEAVTICYIAVKDNEQRFDLLRLAYWLKKALNKEFVYVLWDNGVVQFVGHPDDNVRHDWGTK